MFDRDVVDLSLHRVMELHHRAVSREQMRRFEGYLAEIFAACGLNLNTPATEETPQRFLLVLFEATEGYDGEPKLLTVFDTECRLGQVIEGPIPFFALCEHHALPFFGHAHIGYLQAHHLCVEMRGVRDTSPVTQMTVWRGEYEHNASLRVEFLLACGAER